MVFVTQHEAQVWRETITRRRKAKSGATAVTLRPDRSEGAVALTAASTAEIRFLVVVRAWCRPYFLVIQYGFWLPRMLKPLSTLLSG